MTTNSFHNDTDLEKKEQSLSQLYQQFKDKNLKLDLTRGKPSPEQLDLSNGLLRNISDDYRTQSKVDTRNYGGLDGIGELKPLASWLTGVEIDEVLVGGNSSLNTMYNYMLFCHHFGVDGINSAWKNVPGGPKFLCPSPGYDRHFKICEQLGIEMIAVPFNDDGPDMDIIEDLVEKDDSIKGIWCVPKYSNPTGHIYSADTVYRIAKLKKNDPYFRVMWDNAYVVHDLDFVNRPKLNNLMHAAKEIGTENHIIITASTSKITFAGAGVSFMGASSYNIGQFKKFIAIQTIGPNKLNQLTHHKFLKDQDCLLKHMEGHAEILKPKFALVEDILEKNLSGGEYGTWTKPQGGYFVSFDTKPGLAKEVVRLASEVGIKITPAGATYPLGKDSNDCNIRIAPSFPPIDELEEAMKVFVVCVQLATIRQQLKAS